MKQCRTKRRENSTELCVLPPLLEERAGVRADVSTGLIFDAFMRTITAVVSDTRS